MPRAKKAPGHQHNSRHENGVVAPGKRVAKQKSNGQLNGTVETSARVSVPSLPPASVHTTAVASEPRVNGAPTGTKDSSRPVNGLANGSPTDSVEVPKVSANEVPQADGTEGLSYRDVRNNTAKSPGVHRDSVVNLALTILRACPLGDTIAILLVLLWLPPTLLTITNALFAVLTFMPPAVALPSFPPTFNDLFVGSGNTPSLATIFLTDIIGLILWLVIWTPVQTLAIELAQAVVATTLGGGSSGKNKGSDSTMFCMTIVAINHVVRHDWLPRQIFGFDWPAILSKIPYVSKDPPSFLSDLKVNDYITSRSPASWVRVLVALHILIQGLVHVARRWYQQRDYTQANSINKKADTEAIPTSLTRANNIPAADGGMQFSTPSSPDATTKPPIPKELRERVSIGKKRRRQGALVRSQQPLWAAFAATKLTVLREFEHSQALKEVASSQATDVKNLGNAQFAGDGGRVWVSDVQPDSFRLETTLTTTSENLLSETGTDPVPKPFRVRVNDMDWVSTKIELRAEETRVEQWTCAVFGLSPASSYRCSLIRSEDDLVIYSSTITTPPTQSNKRECSVPIEPCHQTYQPSSPKSPITTLRKSINAAEANLSESQARQKRLKKDTKAGAATLKKDLDVLNSKINKLASEDKAHANRHMQWSQLTRQADDALVAISSELESLEKIPSVEVKPHKETEAAWDEIRKVLASAREETNRNKDEANKEKSSVQNEAATSQQKRERLVARKAKLHDQHERLETATAHGIDEKERKTSEQAAKDLERFQLEHGFAEQMQGLVHAVHETRFLAQRTWNQQKAVEAAFHQRQMMENAPLPKIERPLTPEGDLPGTNPQSASNNGIRAQAFGSPGNAITGLRSHSGSFRQGDNRPRSTSGLSGSSVYADFDDQDPAPPMPTRAVEVIKERSQMHSRNSGHGSGSSGSQRDPASPVGGHGVQISPVGKKGPVWNP